MSDVDVTIPPGFGLPIDPGIAPAVRALRTAGIDTFESCQGGPGHACPEPTVRFHGGDQAGQAAVAVALAAGLPVAQVRKTWTVNDDGTLERWVWELTFRRGEGR